MNFKKDKFLQKIALKKRSDANIALGLDFGTEFCPFLVAPQAQGLWFPRKAKLASLFCAIWSLLASFPMNNLTNLEKRIMKNTVSNNKSRFLSILVVLTAILSPIAVQRPSQLFICFG